MKIVADLNIVYCKKHTNKGVRLRGKHKAHDPFTGSRQQQKQLYHLPTWSGLCVLMSSFITKPAQLIFKVSVVEYNDLTFVGMTVRKIGQTQSRI